MNCTLPLQQTKLNKAIKLSLMHHYGVSRCGLFPISVTLYTALKKDANLRFKDANQISKQSSIEK